MDVFKNPEQQHKGRRQKAAAPYAERCVFYPTECFQIPLDNDTNNDTVLKKKITIKG